VKKKRTRCNEPRFIEWI